MISGKPYILVVDDDPVSLGFLTAALEQCGCSVAGSGTATAALAAASTAKFDLLLVDRCLPDADGVALLRRLRGAGVVAPAIATSAEIEATDEAQLIDAGFVATLRKPADVATIHALVRRCIDLPTAETALQPGAVDRPHDADPILDDAAALVAIGGDRAALLALRRLFAGELETLIAQLQGEGALADTTALADRLHRLRASCGFCGATALGAAAAVLESSVRSGARNLHPLEETFRRVCAATRAALVVEN